MMVKSLLLREASLTHLTLIRSYLLVDSQDVSFEITPVAELLVAEHAYVLFTWVITFKNIVEWFNFRTWFI